MAYSVNSVKQEAASWLGGGSGVLGRAQQVGPHPYAVLTLFPADERLRRKVPSVRTPFQVYAFHACGGHSVLFRHFFCSRCLSEK